MDGITMLAEDKGVGRSDRELEAEIADIDRNLDNVSAWLTPQFRSGLLAAREVLVRVLERRRSPWRPVFAHRPPRRRGTAGETDLSLIGIGTD